MTNGIKSLAITSIIAMIVGGILYALNWLTSKMPQTFHALTDYTVIGSIVIVGLVIFVVVWSHIYEYLEADDD